MKSRLLAFAFAILLFADCSSKPADGWPVLVEKDGAKWDQGGLQGDYSYLRDYSNPLLWAKWQPGFKDGVLWTTTAVDASYEITAEFDVPEGASAGLYLFYNEEANFGLESSDATLAVRIRNERNKATLWQRAADGSWTAVYENVDVSSYHHNNYKGFFALRPAATAIARSSDDNFFIIFPPLKDASLLSATSRRRCNQR